MKKLFTSLLILSQLVLFGQSENKEKTIEQKLKYFLELSDSLLIKTNTAGVGIAIVYDGEILYKGGLGYSDVANKTPVTENTLFPIGSNTKPMTGIIASRLVEKGLLDWNAPVKNYYPEFKVDDDYVTENATIKDLFTHMTGVGRYDLLYYKNSSITRDEILEKLPLMKSKFPIRQQYSYNNFMYLIAGIVEEKVSGKNWGNLLKDEVFAPLHMNNSFSEFQEYLNYKERAKGYKSDGITEVNYQNIDIIAPAGSISSTPNDMALWIEMLANKGKIDNQNYITEDQYNYYTAPHATFNPNRAISSSIGWIMGYPNGEKFIQKEGGIDGFRSKVTITEDNKFGIALMTNNWSDYISIITDYALNIFGDDNYKRDFKWEKSLEYKQSEKIEKNTKEEKPLLHKIDEYIGTYEDEIYGKIMIFKKNKKLQFKFHDFKGKMIHSGFDNFEIGLNLGNGNEDYILHFHTGINQKIDKIEFKLESNMPISNFNKE
jgi:CubicO group peptidase (beta-lactamase class C family)